MKILKIDASISGERSITRKLTTAIAAKLEGDVTTKEAAHIPAIDGFWVGAAYTPPEERTPEQKDALALSDQLIKEITEADAIILGAPIINFGVSVGLKNWIDQIARVGVAFHYTDQGLPVGMLNDKPVFIAYSSGGVPAGTVGVDYDTTYLTRALNFVGLKNIQIIAANGGGRNAAALEAALLEISNLKILENA